jgi:exopolysaccharide biosynthesis polyprenyl glycosylphosphotransferase
MLRRHRQIRMQVHQLMDACVFALSFWLAYLVRSNISLAAELGIRLDPVSPFEDYVWLYLILIPVSPLVLEAQGYYNRPLLCSRRTTLWQLFKGCFATAFGLVLVLFFFRMQIARSVVIWFGIISFCLLYAKEELARMALQSKLGQAQHRRRIILLGTKEELVQMREEFRINAHENEIVADLDLNETTVPKLIWALHEHSANAVLLGAKHTFFDQIELVIRACETEGVEVWLVADFFTTQISRTSFDDFYGRPVMVFRTTPEASWQSVIKQVVDLVGSFVLMISFSWLFLLFGLLIRLTSPGPVFFRQQRSGLNGKPFTIYKFRTMVTNAEQLKHELAAMNEMTGPVFKVSNDPRITPMGKFLRKFSIDEWPQLYNVLRGEMSLVGPRPLPVDEVKRFNDLAHRRRLSVKPGLTCLWQVSGRNNLSDFRDWVRLDLEYIDNWSLWLDFKILWRTIPVVLAGTGAK